MSTRNWPRNINEKFKRRLVRQKRKSESLSDEQRTSEGRC
jgi:hypothetical protein